MKTAALLFFLSLGWCLAGQPTTDGLFPIGGQPGSNVTVSLSGKVDPWPPKFWFSRKGITVDAGEKSPKATFKIAANCEPGPILVRAHNRDGCSEPFFFFVSSVDEAIVVEEEKQENRSLRNSQLIESSLPISLYGRLNPSKDIDCYQLSLRKGQVLRAEMDGYAFRTGLDPMLQLYNPAGQRVLLAQDSETNLDPRIKFTAAEPGNYTLAVMAIASPPNANVHFHGGVKCSYRIFLTDKPADKPKPKPSKNQPPEMITPPFEGFFTLPEDGKPHQFKIAGKKSQTWMIEALADANKSPADPVLKVMRPDGRLIREVDDADKITRDSSYSLKISSDGDYPVEVRDRFRNGGAGHNYQLKISTPTPSISATIDKSSIVLDAGKQSTVKLKLTRTNNHKAELELKVKHLPKNIELELPEKFPEKTGDVSIKLKPTEDAKDFSGPIAFVWEEKDKKPVSTRFMLRDSNARGDYLINETDIIWLTIKAKSEDKKADED